MAKILLVDDDDQLRDTLRSWLEFEHYLVEESADGSDALDRLHSYAYDLLAVDWNLPGVSGIELCQHARRLHKSMPILMLTGKGSLTDKESGFGAGADDYLTKPFHVKEFVLRVKALLRRSSGASSDLLEIGDLALDTVRYRVVKGGNEIRLLPKEFALLEFLMRHPDQVFSADALLERVWHADSDATGNAVTSCIKRLRKKLNGDAEESVICTVHGVGYKLVTQKR